MGVPEKRRRDEGGTVARRAQGGQCPFGDQFRMSFTDRQMLQALRANADPLRVPMFRRFFRTGPGEYAEGDPDDTAGRWAALSRGRCQDARLELYRVQRDQSEWKGAVAIGRNEGERLKACLRSLVQVCDRVVYVDSGSQDDSVAFARSIGVDVVELDTSTPFTAARARNMDADFAVETANLSRAQILQQAGNTMVAQANQLPQQVLQLLRS